jgi:HD superfamily phosphodiesterase
MKRTKAHRTAVRIAEEEGLKVLVAERAGDCLRLQLRAPDGQLHETTVANRPNSFRWEAAHRSLCRRWARGLPTSQRKDYRLEARA